MDKIKSSSKRLHSKTDENEIQIPKEKHIYPKKETH